MAVVVPAPGTASNRDEKDGLQSTFTSPAGAVRGRASRFSRPLAARLGPRDLHVALPRMVDPADRHRHPLLVQPGQVAELVQGLSLRWYLHDPGSVLRSAALHGAVVQTLKLGLFTTIITVPLGVAFAIGIDRWRSRTSDGFNFLMIFSFVVPELLLAVALFFVFDQLFTFIHFGTGAETAALVVFNLSWPAIIVRARLISIGRSYEEAAADLGASRLSACGEC